MIPDNVTLIVKAPNQQIEDQNIECQSSWTVRELKGHLSEVYPSKPTLEEQKIIYSGQLLDDNTILKDVLRTYDCQLAHTVHLVCTPKRRLPETAAKETPISEGVRQRNVPNTQEDRQGRTENVSRPEVRQNDQNHTVEMQNYLSTFVNNYGRVPQYPNYNFGEGYLPVPNDPASMANHMLMMQQAYLQYMQQYANMWQGGNLQQPPPAENTPPPAPEAPVAQPDDAEEGAVARDWLDHIYAASRLAILLSLVYLYGSPARLLLVLLIAAAGYLHQIGFFRDLHVNPLNENRNPIPANPPAADNEENQNENVAPNDNVNANVNANNEAGNANNVIPNVTNLVIDDNQSLLAVTWMIFTSFFASLIPDSN